MMMDEKYSKYLKNKYIWLLFLSLLIVVSFETLPFFIPNVAFLHSNLSIFAFYDTNFGVACMGAALIFLGLTKPKRIEIVAALVAGVILEWCLYHFNDHKNVGTWQYFIHFGISLFPFSLIVVLKQLVGHIRCSSSDEIVKSLEILGLGLCMPTVYILSGGLIGLRGNRFVLDGILLASDNCLSNTQPAFIISAFLRRWPIVNNFMVFIYDYLAMWMLLAQVAVYLHETDSEYKNRICFIPVLTYAVVFLIGARYYVYFPGVGTEAFCGTGVFPNGPFPDPLAYLNPVEAPPFLHRNAMPSLHLTWILCAFLSICRLGKYYAYTGATLVVLTLFSAFSIGCHWLTDFIVALPFCVLCIALTSLSMKPLERFSAILWGSGASLFILYMLKNYTDLLLKCPKSYLATVVFIDIVSVLFLYVSVHPKNSEIKSHNL